MSKKYSLTLFIALFNIIALFSASIPLADSLTIPIYSYFDKGESQRYVIKQGKMKYKGETPTDSSETKKTITLTVIDSTTEGYVMEVFAEDFENSISDAKALEKVLEDKKMTVLVKQYANLRLRFQITLDGQFKGFENMDSLIQLTQIMGEFLKQDFGKDVRTQKIAAEMSKKMMSPAIIQEKLGLPFQQMFFFHGHEYMADTIVDYADELSNNLNPDGEPFPTEVSVLYTYDETDSTYINIEQLTEPDQDLVTEEVINWTKKLFPKSEHKGLEKMRISMVDHLDMEIHQPSGWVTYLLKKRTTTAKESEEAEEDTTSVDYLEIEIITKSSEKEGNN